MAFISQDEISNIRSNVNIVDVIGNYLPLTQKGKNYFCVCPFHDDHTPSMSVSAEKQIYKCFSCGASGNVFTFVQNYENLSFAEAVQTIARGAGLTLSQKVNVNVDSKFKTDYEIMNLANKFYQNNLKTEVGKKAKKYLTDRGITEEIISEFEIGLALDGGKDLTNLLLGKKYDIKILDDLGITNNYDGENRDVFTKRIMFPIHDYKGNIVAFTGRIYTPSESAKYVNNKETKIFKKGTILYNYHNASKHSRVSKKIIVVEGNMDAIRLSSCGIKNVVALMGTSLTNEQIELLKKLKSDIILCLDSDASGLAATNSIGELLSNAGLDIFVVKLTGAKDPDDYIVEKGLDAFKTLLNNPIKYFDYKMDYLRVNLNLENADDLAKYINSIMDYLNTIDDEILKEITINKLHEDFNISVDVLKSKLKLLDKKSEVKPKKEVIRKQSKTGYEKAAEKILYYMMSDGIYIKMYQKLLGYLETPIYRNIANEIIYYYKINNEVDLADFISFISEKSEINNKIMDIIGSCDETKMEMNDFEANIEAIKKEQKMEEIKKLKRDLKNELDLNKKNELLAKLTEIKKEVV